MRVLFVNENLGGHAALHLHLRRALVAEHPDVAAHFVDVPPPRLVRRFASLPVPGLARFDADLQPLRSQLALSATVARTLARVARDYDVVHVYSQNAGLLSGGILRSVPAVVSTDTTNVVNAYQIPYRAPGPGTAASLRPAMFLERRVFDAATLVVAQSEWAARQLERYGVPRHRIRVIPFGITVGPITTARPAPGPPRVTFVGTTMGRKGGWTLLRAYRESLAGRCRLTLVTRDRVPSTPGVEVVNDASPGDGRVAGLLAETSVFALPTEIDKSPTRCWRPWPPVCRSCPRRWAPSRRWSATSSPGSSSRRATTGPSPGRSGACSTIPTGGVAWERRPAPGSSSGSTPAARPPTSFESSRRRCAGTVGVDRRGLTAHPRRCRPRRPGRPAGG